MFMVGASYNTVYLNDDKGLCEYKEKMVFVVEKRMTIMRLLKWTP